VLQREPQSREFGEGGDKEEEFSFVRGLSCVGKRMSELALIASGAKVGLVAAGTSTKHAQGA
jgi:hypothetical protein